MDVRKALVVIWVVFGIAWSVLLIFALFLGAGMSVGDANLEPAFLLYWFGPIGVPAVIYRLISKRRRSSQEKGLTEEE